MTSNNGPQIREETGSHCWELDHIYSAVIPPTCVYEGKLNVRGRRSPEDEMNKNKNRDTK